jgi:hypothetical protein
VPELRNNPLPPPRKERFVRRFLSTLTTSAVVAGGILLAGTPAEAAPSLRFHGTQYDSPGKDTRTNASLTAEWISLVNSGSKSVNLQGWTIRDTANHVYTFGNVTIPGKGGRIWLRTGKGTNNAKNLYWGSGNYIWNNTGDAATLRNKAGAKHDTCSWKSKKGRTWVTC